MHSYWSFSGPLLVAGAAGFVMAWSAVLAAKLHLGIAAVGVITLAATISSFTDRVDALVGGDRPQLREDARPAVQEHGLTAPFDEVAGAGAVGVLPRRGLSQHRAPHRSEWLRRAAPPRGQGA